MKIKKNELILGLIKRNDPRRKDIYLDELDALDEIIQESVQTQKDLKRRLLNISNVERKDIAKQYKYCSKDTGHLRRMRAKIEQEMKKG